MYSILILKTAALGDVLRTTSILPGLHERYTGCRITWVTAPAAVELLRTHPLIARVESVDPASDADLEALRGRLSLTPWSRVVSLDDEPALCRLASVLKADQLSGAYLRVDGQRAYTPDVAAWFDMGLLSVQGKAAADRLKIENRKSHPQIYAQMLGIALGKPRLELSAEARAFAARFAARHELAAHRPVIGLNTGAGGRWVSKQLSVERTVELGLALDRELDGRTSLLILGGASEVERNRAILAGLRGAGVRSRVVDAGCDNALLDFAAVVDQCDLLVSSDSLALHVAIARGVRCVAFFAPTSAAEIELYGRGEKVASTATDYCSYRPDADNTTITVPRLLGAVVRQLSDDGSRA